MNNLIRLVRTADAPQILSMYDYYINNTAITFETSTPDIESFTERIEHISSFYPWLVYENEAKILGYAYASQHRQRSSYRWSVDVTVYIHQSAHGKGIGSQLYEQLLSLLQKQGFYNAYAGITLPNEKSIALHEKFGFVKIGQYNRVGYKINKWWNVGWWECEINVKPECPEEPKEINADMM